MPDADKNKLNRWLAFLIAGSAVALIIRYFTKHSGELDIIFKIKLGHLAYLFLIYFVIHLITAAKTLLILKKLNLNTLSFFQWLKIYTVSRFANLHITQGANLYLSVKLKKEHRYPYTNTLSFTTIFSWFEAVTILTLLLFITLCAAPQADLQGFKLSALTMTAIILLTAVPFAAEFILGKFKTKEGLLNWLHNRLSLFMKNTTGAIKNKKLVLNLIGINIIWFVIFVYWIKHAFLAIGAPVGLVYLTTYTAFIILSRIINIVPGNIGIREALGGYLGEMMGFSFSEGVIVSALVRAVEYLLVIVLGMLFARTIFIKKQLQD